MDHVRLTEIVDHYQQMERELEDLNERLQSKVDSRTDNRTPVFSSLVEYDAHDQLNHQKLLHVCRMDDLAHTAHTEGLPDGCWVRVEGPEVPDEAARAVCRANGLCIEAYNDVARHPAGAVPAG